MQYPLIKRVLSYWQSTLIIKGLPLSFRLLEIYRQDVSPAIKTMILPHFLAELTGFDSMKSILMENMDLAVSQFSFDYEYR